MVLQSLKSRAASRKGFTLIELLVAVATIIFIMTVLSERFDGGIAAFRRLKAIGDMNERLRTTTSVLRRDLAAAHFSADRFIADTWKRGWVDREDAANVREHYEAVAADAVTVEEELWKLEQRTSNPAARYHIRRTRGTLAELRDWNSRMILVIALIEPFGRDD